MTRQMRWGLWLSLLGIAAALVISDLDRTSPAAIVQDVPPAGPAQAARPAVPAASPQTVGGTLLAIRPRSGATRIADAFTPHDWTPPPPPPKPVVVPPPAAPAVPYTVLGKQFEDGQWQVFLGREDQVFVVKDQDTIENTYRVENTKPPLMTLTYLPLHQRQTLSIGDVQ